MPVDVGSEVVKELLLLIPTVIYFLVGAVLFGVAIWVMEKVTPFSIRKEIEEDQNTALGIIIGATIIALAILLSAAIR